MTIGQIALGIVGGVVGFYTGGAGWALVGSVMMGASLGVAAGTFLDPSQSDVPSPGTPQMQDLDVPTIEEGTAIYDLIGTSKVVGQILWYGKDRSKAIKQKQESGGKGGGGKSEKVIVGYKYYLSWAQGICLGTVDQLYTVFRDDEPVWTGTLENPVTGGGEETITLEGMGSMTLYFGTDDQVANYAMGAEVGAAANPSWRGLCWAYFDDVYVGKYNRAPRMKFILKKRPSYAFNLSYAIGLYDYNPAHAIYHFLTDPNYVGMPSTWINEESFSDFADLMQEVQEQHGVSMLITRQDGALKFIESVLTHIGGVMRYGIDGKFHLHALRDDVAIPAMPSITQDDFLEPMVFERKGWPEVVNEVQVQHHIRYDMVTEGEVGIGAFDPDDSFPEDEDDPPDTDKWYVTDIPSLEQGGSGGTNLPVVKSQQVYWHGEKTAEGAGEEAFRMRSNWWFPKGQDAIEIEIILNWSVNYSTGQLSYGPLCWKFGLIPKAYGNEDAVNASDRIQIFTRPGNITIDGRAGIGTSGGYTYSVGMLPLKVRVRREMHPDAGDYRIKTGLIFYNNNTSQWMNFNGEVDTWWWGAWEADWDSRAFVEFSTQSIFRTATSEFTGTVDDFKVLEGAILCCGLSSTIQNEYFTQADGTPPDTDKWTHSGTADKARVALNTLLWNDSQGASLWERYIVDWFFCTWQTSWTAEIDFSFDEMSGGSGDTGPYIRLGLYNPSVITANQYKQYIEITWTPNGGLEYKAQTADSIPSGLDATGVTYGKLRIRYDRTAPGGYDDGDYDSVYFWYWNSLLKQWEYDGDTDGLQLPMLDVVTNFAKPFIEFGNNAGEAVNLRIDNFQITEGGTETTCAAEIPPPVSLNIRRAAVSGDDRGTAEIQGRAITKSVQLMGFGSTENANWAAERAIRRAAYPFVEGQLVLNRSPFKLEVGDLFKLSDSEHNIVDLPARVMQINEGPLESEKITVSFMEEPDYATSSAVLASIGTEGSLRQYGLEPLTHVGIVEAPYPLVGEQIRLLPLAARETGAEIGYEVWVSVDGGVSYQFVDDVQYYATYGTLVAELNESVLTLDKKYGFEVDFYGADAEDIATITRTEMFSNENMAILGDEILNFETITPDGVEEGRYKIEYLSRARFDSVRKTHAVDEDFWFVGTIALQVVANSAFVKGATLKFKLVPYNDKFVGDISEATPVDYTIVGRAIAPYVPGNLNASGRSQNATYGRDVHLTWNPRIRGQDSGVSNPDSVIDYSPTHEGKFEIAVKDSIGTLVRTVTDLDDYAWTYTQAMNVADNGALESLLGFELDNFRDDGGVRYTNIHTRSLEVTLVSSTTTSTTTTTTTT